MTSSKPYLLRAIYEWLLDNNLTPHIAVNTDAPDILVPKQFSKDNKIILNIAPIATKDFFIDNEAIRFKARFGGVSHNVYVPITAIIAIYAQENNRGMAFPPEEFPVHATPKPTQKTPTKKPAKPKLTVLRGGK